MLIVIQIVIEVLHFILGIKEAKGRGILHPL